MKWIMITANWRIYDSEVASPIKDKRRNTVHNHSDSKHGISFVPLAAPNCLRAYYLRGYRLVINPSAKTAAYPENCVKIIAAAVETNIEGIKSDCDSRVSMCKFSLWYKYYVW